MDDPAARADGRVARHETLTLTPDVAPAADAARPARIVPWLCALAAVVLLCVAPSTAAAGTLTLRWLPEGDDAEYDVPGMTFRASAGERNSLVVRGGDRRIEIRDVHPIRLVVRERPRGPRLPSCRRLAAGRLRCAAPADEADGDVYLGDKDDRLFASGAMSFSVSGGDGDDVIRAGQASGGPGRDVLTGGPRADYLSGGPGRDRVRGGGGHDTVCGDCEGSSGAWSDVVEGGDGVDEVTLSGGRIRVDLSRPDRDGDVRAPDVLRGVETIRVWSREDALLIGDDNPNTLISDGPGADHVDGRGGDDRVIGGAGDRVSGGDGDDVVSASFDSADDPGADRPAHLLGDGGEDYLSGPTNAVLDCGPGEDAIRLPTYLEVRARSDETSCEFYADQRGVAEPLWIGRDLRVLEDAFEVVLKWRRRAPAAFVARATWGPATELVRAEARGTLAPGVSTIRLPLTGPGATRLPRDCSVLLSVTSQRASSSLFGSWLPFGPCVPSSPEAA